jgi:predicted MFS family arabinose efflux permease
LILLILSKAHAVAKSSLVPATVDSPDDLVKAGGRLAVLSAVASLAAGGPAAVVLKVFDAHWVLRMAAVAYAVGAVMALRTRPAPPSEPDPADHIDEVVRSRGVSLAALAMASLRGMSGFLTFAVAFSFRRAHAPAWWYGLVLAGGIIGGFAGNLIGPRLRDRLREEHIMLLALGIVATAGLFVAFVGAGLLIVLVALSLGVADGIGQLAFDAIVQRDGAEGSRARSFARFEATFQLAWVAAAVIPVALPIATWLTALLVGVAAVASALNYSFGRFLISRPSTSLPGPPSEASDPDPPWPDPPGSGSGAAAPSSSAPASSAPASSGLRWSDGSPPPAGWSGGSPPPAGWSDAEPAPVRDAPPQRGLPGPRRNPHRAGREQ